MQNILPDILISIAALSLIAAMGLTAWSVVHSVQVSKIVVSENRVPVRALTLGTAVLPLVVAVPCLLIGSIADMCIITSLVMLTIGAIITLAGRMHSLGRAGARRRRRQTP